MSGINLKSMSADMGALAGTFSDDTYIGHMNALSQTEVADNKSFESPSGP